MSEDRRIRRFLFRRYKKGLLRSEVEKSYLDNKNVPYPYSWLAKVSSFFNVITGCFKNGFPIVVPKLWYLAWAFYPFFFVRKDLNDKNALFILNHERIHIRQQRDIHLTISVPLLLISIFLETLKGVNPLLILCWVPFIPTLIYGFEMIHSWVHLYRKNAKITFNSVRENTCFEKESIRHATDVSYLFRRKFWAVLSFI